MQYARKPGQNRSGANFDEYTKRLVWQKGQVVAGFDPNLVRKDCCGVFIQWVGYGNTASPYGWEIDHIKPVDLLGNDNMENLQPLQWQNNRYKSNSFPEWSCKLGAKPFSGLLGLF
jgi:hypothetical protein